MDRSKKGVFTTHSRKYGIAAVQRMLPVLAAEWYEAWGDNSTPPAGPSTSGQEQPLSRPAKRRPVSFGTATPSSELRDASISRKKKKKNTRIR